MSRPLTLLEALALVPVVHKLRDRALFAGRTVEVAEVQRQLDQFLNVDAVEDGLGIFGHGKFLLRDVDRELLPAAAAVDRCAVAAGYAGVAFCERRARGLMRVTDP